MSDDKAMTILFHNTKTVMEIDLEMIKDFMDSRYEIEDGLYSMPYEVMGRYRNRVWGVSKQYVMEAPYSKLNWELKGIDVDHFSPSFCYMEDYASTNCLSAYFMWKTLNQDYGLYCMSHNSIEEHIYHVSQYLKIVNTVIDKLDIIKGLNSNSVYL